MRSQWIVAIAITLWVVAVLSGILTRPSIATLEHLATVIWSGFITAITCWGVLHRRAASREALFHRATYLQGRINEKLAAAARHNDDVS